MGINKNEYFENDFILLWIENGILRGKFKPDIMITRDMPRIIVEERLKLCQGISYPNLSDIRQLKGVQNDARKYFSTREANEKVKAGALLVGKRFHSLLGNAFLMINRPPLPTKIFKEEDKALDWLEDFKVLNNYG